MCFTVLGRAQTRLLSLVLPLCVTVLYSTFRGNGDYWTLFNLMVVVGFLFDFGLYAWVIRYQPRWLSIALGIGEYLVIQQVVESAPFIHVRLEPAQALEFYIVAWTGAWLTTQVLLPLFWPRWAEDGGELRYETGAAPTGEKRQAQERALTLALTLLLLSTGALLGFVSRPLLDALSAAARPNHQLTLMEVVVARTRHFKGDPTAPVTIVEFGSFACVPCAQSALGAGYQIDQSYVRSGIVRYGYSSLALDATAQLAAEAGECAEEQEAFWPYYQRLYEHVLDDQGTVPDLDVLAQIAEQLHLDTSKFKACVESGRYSLLLLTDRNNANALGIATPPKFLVNGQWLTGAQSFDAWQELIERERARKP